MVPFDTVEVRPMAAQSGGRIVSVSRLVASDEPFEWTVQMRRAST